MKENFAVLKNYQIIFLKTHNPTHLEDYKNIKFWIGNLHVWVEALDNVGQALLLVSTDDGGHFIRQDPLQHLNNPVLTYMMIENFINMVEKFKIKTLNK